MKAIIVCITGLLLLNSYLAFSQEEDDDLLYCEESFTFPYDLSKADNTIKLPPSLEEVSGVSYFNNNIVACVQDENAIIYFVDLKNGDVIKKVDFGKSGDYEDIVIVNRDAWVINSKGNLYFIKDCFSSDDNEAIKYKTDLSSKNNCEGLTFDADENCLLIACKESPNIDDGDHFDDHRAIYKFDLNTQILNETPEYLISLDTIKKYLEYGYMEKLGINLLKTLNRSGGDVSFQPSGICFGPENKDLWIISSVGKLFVIISPDGKIKYIRKLPRKLFPQPEGICLDSDKNLIISNEGKNSSGKIRLFNKLNEQK